MERIYNETSALNSISQAITSNQISTFPDTKKLNNKVNSFSDLGFHATTQISVDRKSLLSAKFMAFALILLLSVGGFIKVQAATTYTWDGSSGTAWDDQSNWTPEGIPGSAPDDVVIIVLGASSRLPILTTTPSYALASLTFAPDFITPLKLTITNATLSVTGAVTLKSRSGTPSTCTIEGTGTLACASFLVGTDENATKTRTTTITLTLSSLIVSGNLTIRSYINGDNISKLINSSFIVSSGSVTVNGSIITSNENALNISTFLVGNTNPTLNLNGATPFVTSAIGSSTITLNGTGATVNYNRTGDQTVRATSYTNLSLSGSGIKTISAGTSVSENLNIAGNATVSAGGATCKNLTLEQGASILGNSYLTVSSKSEFKQNIDNDNNWHFLSSPIANFPIWPEFAPSPSGSPLSFGLAPWNWDFYYFNPNANFTNGLFWVNLRLATTGNLNTEPIDQAGDNAGFGSNNPTFTSGRGYLVAYNQGWNPATGSPKIHSFNGTNPSTFFSGDLTISRTNSSQAFNLVGNPYPSSIDWKENAGWDRNDLKPSSGGFDYWIMTGTGNYGVYNSADGDDNGTSNVTRYIAPAQGFMVEATDLGSFSMKILEAARVHSSQPWLKNEVFDPGRLRLKITTSANTYSDEMIVAYNSTYTGNGGSAKLFSWYVEAPEIYSVKEGNNFSIDRYNDIQTDITVNINTKTGIEADYTITATNISDFNLSSKVLLEDLKTGIVTDLKQTPAYTFAGSPGDDASRFRLIIGSPIGIDEPNTNGSFNIYTYENMVYVQNDKINESYFVTVSNMLGQVLVRNNFSGNSLNRIEMHSVPGVYVVNVVSNGKTYSQKVVIR
jgi:hypothetical protein